jgi:DNA topoisomerase-1
MEERLDEIANGSQEWVPIVRDFYGPFRELVDIKRKELKRSDITTEPSDEVCSEGHPMVIRLGRNGRFLACSLYPEHKESRPLPGEEPETKVLAGEGETCPQCGEGTLVQKRGRFGAFVGCSRYPDCSYIHKDGPPPPAQLPFDVTCPTCKEGHLVARRARRTGSVFYGCSRYPKCRFTTSREPVGAVHDTDGGPVARNQDGTAICLACGAPISLPDHFEVGEPLTGGPADPTALAPAARRGRTGGTGTAKGRAGGTRAGGSRTRRAAKPAA